MVNNTKQKEYQQKYDKKTKIISVKYVLRDMDEYDRLKNYLDRTGKSANAFIKELIKDFFDKEKYVLNDKKIAEYFADYEVSEELLDKLKNIVGIEKFDLIMDYCKGNIESELYTTFLDRGEAFDEWIEQFIEDIECGNVNIDVSDKDFKNLISSSISDSMGYVYYS